MKKLFVISEAKKESTKGSIEDPASEMTGVDGSLRDTVYIRKRRELWSMAVAALARLQNSLQLHSQTGGSVLLLERNRETSTNLNARSPTDRH